MAANARVVVRDLTKVYRTRERTHTALDNVSLEIGAGEFVVLLGPSGCGKTTLLRCVAGLEKPDTGTIDVHGRTVFSSSQAIARPPEQRNLSMVFQSYALWPHMSVRENVAYPLRNAGVASGEIAERVAAMLKLVGLEAQAGAYPGQLSGGQQQRVALARAIIGNDGLILFDEPLSNLDAKVRDKLRLELIALQREIQFSALYVTHDQTEALILADRIAVMGVGRIAQIGAPAEIYLESNSRYVADFIGGANEIVGALTARDGDWLTIASALGELKGRASVAGLAIGAPVSVMFRPEHCHVVQSGGTDVNVVRGVVRRSLFLGSHMEYVVEVGPASFLMHSKDITAIAEGSAIVVRIEAERMRVFPAEGAP